MNPGQGRLLRELALLRGAGGVGEMSGLALAYVPREAFDEDGVDGVVQALLGEIRGFVGGKMQVRGGAGLGGESPLNIGIIIPSGVLVQESAGEMEVERGNEFEEEVEEELVELAWMPGPRRAFARFCEGLEAGVVEMMRDGELGGGEQPQINLILWPFAHQGVEGGGLDAGNGAEGAHGGAISDVPSIQTFFRERSGSDAGQGGMLWKLLFDPAWLLTPSMRVNAMDHLQRMFAVCGTHPMAWGVVLDRGLGGEVEREVGRGKPPKSSPTPTPTLPPPAREASGMETRDVRASVAAMYESCGLVALERE